MINLRGEKINLCVKCFERSRKKKPKKPKRKHVKVKKILGWWKCLDCNKSVKPYADRCPRCGSAVVDYVKVSK